LPIATIHDENLMQSGAQVGQKQVMGQGIKACVGGKVETLIKRSTLQAPENSRVKPAEYKSCLIISNNL
jgi:hypothetical protein